MPARKKTEEVELLLSRFRPGDVAFLQSQVHLTPQQITVVQQQFKALLPEVKVVILSPKARVKVAQSAEFNNTELDDDE